MKLKRIDKKILRFAHLLHVKPGFVKRKTLLHHLKLTEELLDESLKRLYGHGYIKDNVKKTSHDGKAYQLTDYGISVVRELNKPLLDIVKEHPFYTSIIAILVYFFTYTMNIFSPEIKCWILSRF